MGNIPTTKVGGEFEVFRDKEGRIRKRQVQGTGKRMFVPEVLLRRAGFEVFLPVKIAKRRQSKFARQAHLVEYPSLVDWMFVGWPVGQCRWAKLMSLDCVVGVIGTGGRPISVPTSRIHKLMKQWGGGRVDKSLYKAVEASAKFHVGDIVRVLDGPFEEFEASVIEISDTAVHVAVNIFGRDTMLETNARSLEVLIPSQRTGLNQVSDNVAEWDECPRCGGKFLPVRHADGFCLQCGSCSARTSVGSESSDEAIQAWKDR